MTGRGSPAPCAPSSLPTRTARCTAGPHRGVRRTCWAGERIRLSADNAMTARGPRVVLLLGLLCAVTAAAAQTDAKTPGLIRIVVPFSPGGSNDVVARAIAPVLAKRLGNTVIVDNRPGAAGVVRADSVAQAPRDASAVLLTSSTSLTTAATQSRVPYDPIAAFAPVAMVAQGPLLVAIPSSASFKSVRDLLAAARARPGALNYGSAGVGSAGQMATELLNAAAN